MRIALPVGGILLSILSAAAQPAFTSVEIASARTCDGAAEVQSAPVQPSRDLTIAILGDTLREEDSARLRKDIEPLYLSFEKNQVRLAADLQHTYMLAYRPPPASGQRWLTIELMVTGLKGAKIRAKQGYVPE